MSQSNQASDGFVAGVSYFIESFSWLRRRGLSRYVAIPFTVNVLLFSGLIWLYMHYLAKLTIWVNAHIPSWLHWIDWLIYPLFMLIVFVVLSYSFSLVANLIASPFNGFLSAKVELMLTHKQADSEGLIVQVKDVPRIIMRQVQFTVYYLLRAIVCLLFFIIPFLHLIAGITWFIFNAHMMLLQYTDYSMDNHRVPFREMRAILSQHRAMGFGFGAAVMVATFVPILNFFVMPAAVIGGTRMVVEKRWLPDKERVSDIIGVSDEH